MLKSKSLLFILIMSLLMTGSVWASSELPTDSPPASPPPMTSNWCIVEFTSVTHNSITYKVTNNDSYDKNILITLSIGSEPGNYAYIPVGLTGNNDTSFTISGLRPNTTYNFNVEGSLNVEYGLSDTLETIVRPVTTSINKDISLLKTPYLFVGPTANSAFMTASFTNDDYVDLTGVTHTVRLAQGTGALTPTTNYSVTESTNSYINYTLNGLQSNTDYQVEVVISLDGRQLSIGSVEHFRTTSIHAGKQVEAGITGITSSSANINYRLLDKDGSPINDPLNLTVYYKTGTGSGDWLPYSDGSQSVWTGSTGTISFKNLLASTTYRLDLRATIGTGSEAWGTEAHFLNNNMPFTTLAGDPANVVVSISPTSINLANGETLKFTPSISDPSLNDGKYTWASSNTNVATIDSTGLLTTKAAGTTTITVTHTTSNKKATATVNVSNLTLSVSPNSFELSPNTSQTLVVTLNPSSITNQTISWSTSNNSVASVAMSTSTSAVVTAKANGTATITGTHASGRTVTATVNVNNYSSAVVTLNYGTVNLAIGEPLQYVATVSPSSLNDGKITWSSNNTNVATIGSSNGLVSARTTGTATITAYHTTSGKSATSSIRVTDLTITLDPTSADLLVNETKNITAQFNPSDISNKNIVWTTSNSSVATVTNNGISIGTVTGKAIGTATITATHASGKKATFAVTVHNGATVTISPTSPKVGEGRKSTLTATIAPTSISNKTITWSSSNTSIATINSSTGEVTGVKPGTTTITATHTATGQKATVTLTVFKSFLLNRDAWSFINSSASFGYPSGYIIPKERYDTVLPNNSWAQSVYSQLGMKAWGGSCYGFSASSLSFFSLNNALSSYSNSSSVFNVAAPRNSQSAITKFIEEMQIMQFYQSVYNTAHSTNKNNKVEFINKVKAFADNSGEAIILLVGTTNGGGHAVVPIDIVEINNEYRITVYDNNHPNTDRYFFISKDGASWRFDLWYDSVARANYTWRSSDAGAYVTFVEASQVYNAYRTRVLDPRGIIPAATPNSLTPNVKLEINSTNVQIFNKGDNKNNLASTYYVATYDYNPNVQVERTSSSFYLPQGEYDIIVNDVKSSSTLIDIAGVEQYTSLSIGDNQAKISLNTKVKDNVQVVVTPVDSQKPLDVEVKVINDKGGSKSYNERISTSYTLVSAPSGINFEKVEEKPLEPVTPPSGTTPPVTPNPPVQPPTTSEVQPIIITIDSTVVTQGSTILPSPDVPAQIINDRTMMPFRYLIQTLLGGTVDFDETTYTITAEVNGHYFELTIGDPVIYVDGESIILDQAPVIVDSRTLVPLRAFEKAVTSLGWNADARQAIIYP